MQTDGGPCAATEHFIAQCLRLLRFLVQVSNKGNVESLFMDLLKFMRHTVQDPREEEAAIIAEGIMSTFCQKWAEEKPRFVEYFSTQWQPKIGNIPHHAGSGNASGKPHRVRDAPTDKSAFYNPAGLVMQLFRDIDGCSINTTSHVEGWHSTLKVSHDYSTSHFSAGCGLTSL